VVVSGGVLVGWGQAATVLQGVGVKGDKK